MFLLGAVGYPLLELLYRKRTHCTMALAGGLSSAFIGRVSKSNACMPMKVLLCTAGITGIEALCGLIWNKNHQIWDYRNLPLNWRGQICLPFSILWGGLSLIMLSILPRISRNHMNQAGHH